jgi:hypothetical protein
MRTLRQITDEHLMAAQGNLDSITIDRIQRPRHIKVHDESRAEVLSVKPKFANRTELFIDFDPHKTYHDEEELI